MKTGPTVDNYWLRGFQTMVGEDLGRFRLIQPGVVGYIYDLFRRNVNSPLDMTENGALSCAIVLLKHKMLETSSSEFFDNRDRKSLTNLRTLCINDIVFFCIEIRNNIIESTDILRSPSCLEIAHVLREPSRARGRGIGSHMSFLESFPLGESSVQQTDPLMAEEFEDPKGITRPDLFSFVVDDDMAIPVYSEIPDVSLELERMDGNSGMTQVVEEEKVRGLNVLCFEVNSEREIKSVAIIQQITCSLLVVKY